MRKIMFARSCQLHECVSTQLRWQEAVWSSVRNMLLHGVWQLSAGGVKASIHPGEPQNGLLMKRNGVASPQTQPAGS